MLFQSLTPPPPPPLPIKGLPPSFIHQKTKFTVSASDATSGTTSSHTQSPTWGETFITAVERDILCEVSELGTTPSSGPHAI
jgi:hypothetical protein